MSEDVFRFVDELPMKAPPPNRTPGCAKYMPRLIEHPGKWAVVYRQGDSDSNYAANGHATRWRLRYSEFEFAVRTVGGVRCVFARFVGKGGKHVDAGEAKDPAPKVAAPARAAAGAPRKPGPAQPPARRASGWGSVKS